jgi:hypothetical protein
VRQGDHESARALYEAVQSVNALPWAKLGIARVELETGQLPQARRTLESLLGEQPSYADAYDVMGRVQVEQGQMDAALETYRNAAKLTPASIARLQKQGMLAFYMGEADEAIDAFERTVRIGISSKMFDCQSLVLLALLHFDKRDTKAFMRTHANLALAAERRPESARLRRFLQVGHVFKALLERQVNDALRHARALAAEARAEDFDFEAASNLLATVARMAATELDMSEGDEWVSQVALRFCVSKAATDMLCMAARCFAPHDELIRQGHHGISGMAERAMTHSVSGSPEAAVKALMVRGSETLNAKLIELAGLVLHRHAGKIGGSADLDTMIGDLRRKYCTKGTQVALGTFRRARRRRAHAAGLMRVRTARPGCGPGP